MRTRRILAVVLAVLGVGLFAATPAQAGNWEETLLDPPPFWITEDVTYTFGYWILQHGSYPFKGGDLGPTALRADDGNGTVIDFAGTETRTAGHYSAEVVFPHNGTWRISSQHEVLMPDENVAVVTVPGSVSISPSQTTERAPYEWGAVRPSFPESGPEPLVEATEVAPRGHEVTEERSLSMWLVVAGGVATVGFALLLGRRYRRLNR
jgi:hypothetical protein